MYEEQKLVFNRQLYRTTINLRLQQVHRHHRSVPIQDSINNVDRYTETMRIQRIQLLHEIILVATIKTWVH